MLSQSILPQNRPAFQAPRPEIEDSAQVFAGVLNQDRSSTGASSKDKLALANFEPGQIETILARALKLSQPGSTVTGEQSQSLIKSYALAISELLELRSPGKNAVSRILSGLEQVEFVDDLRSDRGERLNGAAVLQTDEMPGKILISTDVISDLKKFLAVAIEELVERLNQRLTGKTSTGNLGSKVLARLGFPVPEGEISTNDTVHIDGRLAESQVNRPQGGNTPDVPRVNRSSRAATGYRSDIDEWSSWTPGERLQFLSYFSPINQRTSRENIVDANGNPRLGNGGNPVTVRTTRNELNNTYEMGGQENQQVLNRFYSQIIARGNFNTTGAFDPRRIRRDNGSQSNISPDTAPGIVQTGQQTAYSFLRFNRLTENGDAIYDFFVLPTVAEGRTGDEATGRQRDYFDDGEAPRTIAVNTNNGVVRLLSAGRMNVRIDAGIIGEPSNATGGHTFLIPLYHTQLRMSADEAVDATRILDRDDDICDDDDGSSCASIRDGQILDVASGLSAFGSFISLTS